ncbi:MAG: elongation factor Ts [Clostridia bacterium]|nr:elongation factor Ts [Clostridia bacterium]
MATISAKAVSDLRAKTGCGMMDCKKALVEANGDFDEAIKILREKGLAVAAKKADRIAAEGLVDILVKGEKAAMIEVNCETDFVAKNASFQAFVKEILDLIIDNQPADLAALNALTMASGMTVEAALKDKIFQIGENMSIRRFLTVEGTMSSYIHGKGTTGVIVKFVADDAAKANEGFAEMAKNIALQVAAYPNIQYVDRAAVPASVVEEEMSIIKAQLKNDPKNASKPDQILEKIATGKLGKFYEANCLTENAYVKDDSMTVAKYVESCAKAFGGSIAIDSFYRYEKGEGLQKREDNLGDEIAKMLNK